MNISSDQPCVSICCENGASIYNPGPKCYWNVSFGTKESLFPNDNYLKIRIPVKQNELLPHNMTSCLNDTSCYSDCMSGNKLSTYLSANGLLDVNALIGGGLSCRLDAQDYCFNSYKTDETQNIITDCKRFLYLKMNMDRNNIYLKRAWVFDWSLRTISLPFFLATFFIYTIVPELKNLHGLLLRSYIFCCFVHFITLLIFAGDPSLSCNVFMLILFQIAFWNTHFWLNAMCFDIWWTFRSLNERSNQSTRKKYIFYSIYSWGIPLLLLIVNIILTFDPKYLGKKNQEPIKHCWLQDKLAADLIADPEKVTVVLNICFFILTTINIIRLKKSTAQCLDESESRRYNEEKSRFYLYLKLFIIMGMPFIGDLINSMLSVPMESIPQYVMLVLQVPESVQGPIIFILFVLNARTRRLVAKHLGLKDWSAIQWMQRFFVRIRTFVRGPPPS